MPNSSGLSGPLAQGLSMPMHLIGFGAATGVVSSSSTWNPADKDSTVTLSGGNFIASSSGSATEGNVRTTTSKSSGKYYFEVNYVDVGSNRPPIAIVNSTQSLTSGLGLSTNSLAYYPELPNLYYNSAAGDPIATAVDGTVVGFAADFDNGKLWVRNVTVSSDWNGSPSNNPATNTGGQTISVVGPYFIAAGFNGTASVQLILASGSWTGSAPSGFSAWG